MINANTNPTSSSTQPLATGNDFMTGSTQANSNMTPPITSAPPASGSGAGSTPNSLPKKPLNEKKKLFGLDMKALATVLGLTIFFLVGMAAVLISLRTSFGPQDFSPTAPEAPSADEIVTASCTLSFVVAGEEDPDDLVCGDTCTEGGEPCPQDHTCSNGKCVLDECLKDDVDCDTAMCKVVEDEDPEVVDCGDECNADLICPDDHTCSGGKCVLDECLKDDVDCDTAMCKVVEDEDPDPSPTPTPSPSPSPSPTVSPTASPTVAPTQTPVSTTTTTTTTTQITQEQARASCNQTCSVNSDCANSSHICFDGACRLATNPESVDCTLPKGAQPALPEELPESGATDLSTWLKAGLGILGLGALMLLLL